MSVTLRSLVLVLSLVSVRTQSVDPVVLDLARRWADFGTRLFRTAAARSDQNLLLSTGGASLGLTSVLDRSSGTGRDQLDQVLNLGGVQQVSDLVSGLRAALGEASLGAAVWFQSGVEADGSDSATREHLEKFGTSFSTLDRSRQDSVDSIERWVLDQTRDQVQIQKTGLDLGSDPQLVLASAQDLQARFSVPFNSSLTVEERFFVDRYRTVMIPMMLASGRFYLAYDLDLKLGVLRLGLDRGVAMLVLFPDEGVALGSIEDELSADRVRTWIQSLKKTRLEVQMPRFSLVQAWTLKTVLQKLQVSQVFADNSLSQVLNSAALVVDETSDPLGAPSSFKTPPPRLTVNRPFLLVIYHEATGVLQMIGRVIDPSQK